MSDVKPFAFVLMPFASSFKDVYELGIKATATELGIVAERVDEQKFSETMLERIYRQIDTCDFVIADMTGQNPNVFYEVGYAHAKSKLCALITNDSKDIPFDLKHHPHVIYGGSVSDLRLKLKPQLEWLKDESKKRKTETITLGVKVSNGLLERKDFRLVGSLELVLTLKNESNRRSPEIEALFLTTSDNWSATHKGGDCASQLNQKAKTKRFVIVPELKRLSPGAFSEIRVAMSRTLWSKYGGEELKDTYVAKGNVVIEIATSEGIFKFEKSISTDFDDIPF